MAEYHKSSDETIYKINNAYDNAIKDINEDINNIFYKYKLDSGLNEKEVRQLLNSKIPKKESDSIRARIHGIQDEELKRYMMAQLNANAYKARITRLEALKESIYINSKTAADVEIKQSTKLYTDNIKKAYYSNAFDIQKGLGVGFNIAQMPIESVQEILKNNWSGKHYSKRVWHNTDVLTQKLEEVITSGLMSGKSSRRMAIELEELTNYGKFAAERIIRTETTYISNMAEIESYAECGIDKYIFVATLDLRTSSVCREHDRKVYKREKAEAGINLPPLHPHCRSTTRAYLGKGTLEGIQRRARDPETGKTYLVPRDMSYQDWYDKYCEDKTENFEKMIKNKSSDRQQLKQFKGALGKDSPKTLKDFQDLKYNNSKEWKLLEGYKKAVEKGDISSLTGIKIYKDTAKEIENRLIGINTKDNIQINGYVTHFIDRIIGQYSESNEPIKGKRRGVNIEEIFEALTNPIKTKPGKESVNGERSIKYYGNKCTVSINPDTNKLIQTNPRK